MRILPLSLLLLAVPGPALAAGNVTTTQTGDSITIQGDSATNDYDVKHGTDTMGNDVLVVEGKNGTTINGQPKFEIRLNPGATRFKDVTISDGGGGDNVTVDLSGLPADKRFRELSASGATGGTTTVKNVQTEPGGKIEVRPGGTVSVEDCDTTKLEIEGAGGGTVTVKNCNIDKKLTIDTSGGDATVTVQDSFFGDGKIKGGSKVDVVNRLQFRVQRTNGGKISFDSGIGDDEVAFEDSTVDQVSAKLGDGNDLISFTGSTIEKVSVDGGPGPLDCFDDTEDGNVFGSFKEKGFEPGACDGAVTLEYFDLGANPGDEPPDDAVAWRTNNPEVVHTDGPFALPSEANPLGLPVLDPLDVAPPAHWADPDICNFIHLHDDFEGHDDPAPGPPATKSACGHGVLEWARFVPIP